MRPLGSVRLTRVGPPSIDASARGQRRPLRSRSLVRAGLGQVRPEEVTQGRRRLLLPKADNESTNIRAGSHTNVRTNDPRRTRAPSVELWLREAPKSSATAAGLSQLLPAPPSSSWQHGSARSKQISAATKRLECPSMDRHCLRKVSRVDQSPRPGCNRSSARSRVQRSFAE